MKKLLFLWLCFISLSVFASYDILLENNTPYPLYINTGSYQTLPEKAQGGWQKKRLAPFERAKVQWFSFDEEIKYGHRYTFFVEVKKNSDDKAPLLTFETTIKGFLVGSSIEKSQVTSGGETEVLFSKEPRPYYSTLISKVLNKKPFGHDKTVTIRADAIKYTIPNPHNNFQLTDAIAYVINEKQNQFHQTDDPNKLAVLTYNTQIWPIYGKVGGMIMNNPSRRTEDIASRVNDYDVVTVQEMFEHDYRNKFTSLLTPYLPYHVGPVSDMRPLSSGVVIYSRWPIEKEDSVIYKHCAGLDCGASKGASYALINKYGVRYHIFSTHFQSGSEPRNTFSKKDVVARRQQIEALHAFIEKQKIPKNQAVIVTGDLNTDALSCMAINDCGDFNYLINQLGVNYLPHDNKAVLPYTTDSSKNWMNTSDDEGDIVDYIFALKDHRPLKSYHSRVLALRGDNDAKMFVGSPYGDTDLSDHFPLEAELVF